MADTRVSTQLESRLRRMLFAALLAVLAQASLGMAVNLYVSSQPAIRDRRRPITSRGRTAVWSG